MTATVVVRFADGQTRRVPGEIAGDVVGLNIDGDVLVPFDCYGPAPTLLTPLTQCCMATGKGSADSLSGVVCRVCYRDVSYRYGDARETIAAPRVTPEAFAQMVIAVNEAAGIRFGDPLDRIPAADRAEIEAARGGAIPTPDE